MLFSFILFNFLVRILKWFFLEFKNVFWPSKSWKKHPKKLHIYGSWELLLSLLWSVAVSERILDRGDKTDRMLGVEPVLQISTQWEAGHLGTYCIAPTKSHHTNREMGWLRITYSIFCSKFTQHIAELNSSLPHIIVIMVSLTCLPTMKKIIKALIVKKWKKNHIGTHSFFLWKISKLHWELPSPMMKTIKKNTAPFAY